MSSRVTIDFKNPAYLSRLKLLAASRHESVRDLVMQALDAHFSDYLENKAVQKLAEAAFEEWDNPQDAEYDRL